MNKHKLYEEAISKYGHKAQFNSFTEELLELLLNLHHFKKGKVSVNDVLEEMVDVTIMIEQMRLLFDEENQWDLLETSKLEKLKNHLETNSYKEV